MAIALSYHIPHLSCYALTVEPSTALEKMILNQTKAPVDPEKQAHHFSQLVSWLTIAGFEQYEISNFAKTGYRSKHNSSYWSGLPYLGLGPSAHSFDGESRQWNIRNNTLYLKSIEEGKIPFEKELLTPIHQLNEYIMTRLRTIEGISLNKISERWGETAKEKLLNDSNKYLTEGYLIIRDNQIQLSESGKFLADGIASSLFSV